MTGKPNRVAEELKYRRIVGKSATSIIWVETIESYESYAKKYSAQAFSVCKPKDRDLGKVNENKNFLCGSVFPRNVK